MHFGLRIFEFWAPPPGSLATVLFFSLISNLLVLVSPVFMLQVYDRILITGSIDSLIWLSVMAGGLLGLYAVSEVGRRRVVALVGADFGFVAGEKAFQRFLAEPRRTRLTQDLQLTTRIENFLQSGLVLALFDVIFLPIYVVLLFSLHPVIGIFSIVSIGIILSVAVASEVTSRRVSSDSFEKETASRRYAEGLERQRAAVMSMGMVGAVGRRLKEHFAISREAQVRSTSREGAFSGASRGIRQVLQIAILAIGALLVLQQQMTAGAIVAGSILLGRTLAPIDQIIASWRTLVRAQLAAKDLEARFAGLEDQSSAGISLPKPEPHLAVSRLSLVVPHARKELVRSFSDSIDAGEIVAIVGKNGSGKSTLLSALSGSTFPATGQVSFGNRDLHRWCPDDRGQWVGYLPQTTELLPGSVAENIARFSSASGDEVFDAARAVGAHETILQLPDGYDTQIRGVSSGLSAGQAQLIGLARAFFGDPQLVLLDEPTSHLDHMTALQCVRSISRRAKAGTIFFVATHDIRILQAATKVMMLRDGAVHAIPAAEFLKSQLLVPREKSA